MALGMSLGEQFKQHALDALTWGVRWGVRIATVVVIVGLAWIGLGELALMRAGARAGLDAQAYVLQLQAAGMAPTGQQLAAAIEQRAAQARSAQRPAPATEPSPAGK